MSELRLATVEVGATARAELESLARRHKVAEVLALRTRVVLCVD